MAHNKLVRDRIPHWSLVVSYFICHSLCLSNVEETSKYWENKGCDDPLKQIRKQHSTSGNLIWRAKVSKKKKNKIEPCTKTRFTFPSNLTMMMWHSCSSTQLWSPGAHEHTARTM